MFISCDIQIDGILKHGKEIEALIEGKRNCLVEVFKKIEDFLVAAEQLSDRLTAANQILENINHVELNDVTAIMKVVDDLQVSNNFFFFRYHVFLL